MKIVGITACPTGIAHTYITKKKIIEAAKACDGDLVAALEDIADGAEDAVHNLLNFSSGHVGVVGNLGNQLRSRHDIFNSYPYRHTIARYYYAIIIDKIVRRIKSFFGNQTFFGKNYKIFAIISSKSSIWQKMHVPCKNILDGQSLTAPRGRRQGASSLTYRLVRPPDMASSVKVR